MSCMLSVTANVEVSVTALAYCTLETRRHRTYLRSVGSSEVLIITEWSVNGMHEVIERVRRLRNNRQIAQRDPFHSRGAELIPGYIFYNFFIDCTITKSFTDRDRLVLGHLSMFR